jgi:PAS domain S-box-containing protein
MPASSWEAGNGVSSWLPRLLRFVAKPAFVLALLILSLIGLPFVMISSLSSATAKQMELQADEISTLATGIRSYYADNIVSRLQDAGGKAVFTENYRDVQGGIPIPATLSIELGALFDSAHSDGRINYAFLSDYPFAKRDVPPLDPFEKDALKAFRHDPDMTRYVQMQRPFLGTSTYRLATPVFMRPACVTCHNQHPDSPKTDWKVGDVRGIQEVSVRGIQVDGFGQIGYLLGYVGLLGLVSVGATATFQRQNSLLKNTNNRLREGSQREINLSDKLRQQVQELSLLGAVVENATFGLSIADMRQPDYPLIYVNEAFSKITGYPKDMASGFNCRFLRGPETDPATVAEIARAIREGRSYSCELINYRLNGEKFWNRLTIYPFGGVPGKPDFYVGNQLDITKVKEASEATTAQLAAMKDPVEKASHDIQHALTFSMALRAKLASESMLSDELEAFFKSEQHSLSQLLSQLSLITALMPAPVRNAKL